MDLAAEKAQKEMERDAIRAYLSHPITVKILEDNELQTQGVVAIICDNPVFDLATFFAHFEAVGHLRGLRRAKALIMDDLDEIEEQLKELK
jgi:hypothetical protein